MPIQPLTKNAYTRIMLFWLILVVMCSGFLLYTREALAYERNVLMGVDAELITCFKLTRSSFRALKEAGVPDWMVTNLQKQFQDQLFCSKDDFVDTVIRPNAPGYTTLLLKHAAYPEQTYGFDKYSYKNSSDFTPDFLIEYWAQPVKSLACGAKSDTDDDAIMLNFTLAQEVAQMMNVDAMFGELSLDTTTKDVGLTWTLDSRGTGTARKVTLKMIENVCFANKPLKTLVSVRALVPDEEGDPAIIEKMKVALYKKKEFKVMVRKVLLPGQNLNLDIVSEQQIENYLNEVYKQTAVQWEVDYVRTDDVVNYDLIAPPDQCLEYPADPSKQVERDQITNMPVVQGLDVSKIDAILFLVGTISGDTAGFARVNGLYAFVRTHSSPNASDVREEGAILHTIAHELGHILGLLDLYDNPASHDTENLMYDDTSLRYDQWEKIRPKEPKE